MIVSFSPGRVRLRFKELKDRALAALVCARVKETPGITRAEANPLTGSLLIEYDPALLPPEKFLELGRRELAKYNIKLDPPGFSPY